MIAQPTINQDMAVAVTEEKVRKAQSVAIRKCSDTMTDDLLNALFITNAPPWSNSLPGRPYRSTNEIKEIEGQVGDYRGLRPATAAATTTQVSQMITATTSAVVLHPSDIVINVDNELRSAQFSNDRSIEAMFPGITEEMNRILGG